MDTTKRGKRQGDPFELLKIALLLMERLSASEGRTARQLTEHLAANGWSRDLRSVQRLLAGLEQHFPHLIASDRRHKPYRYHWVAGSAIRLPGPSPEDGLLLQLAQQYLEPLLPPAAQPRARQLFSVAEEQLQRAAQVPALKPNAEWPDKVRSISSLLPLLPPEIPPGVLKAVSQSLYANQVLELVYRTAADREMKQRVRPLGLLQQGPRLYLICLLPNNDRKPFSLALHRILVATDTGQPFERPADFSLDQYCAEGRLGFGHGKRVRLSFWIRKDAGQHLLETRLSADQQVVSEDKGYRIRATVYDSEALTWWLRGFGRQVREVQREPVDRE
jgi:predicted DNA-binding transcriptional regulator YafY